MRLLRWVYVGRLTVVTGIFLGALLEWFRASPATTLLATLLLLGALGMTLGGLWHTEIRHREPGRNFLYLQVLFDALLVTGVVHLTGGSESELAPLYILVIASGGLLLPMPGGVLIGAVASALYFAAIVWFQAESPPGTALLQIGLFAVMALVTGYLGSRLRQTGTRLGEAETQLRQLRLDTSDILRAIDTGVVTVDGNGVLVYMNAAAERLLGMGSMDWTGRAVVAELDRRVPGLGQTIRRSSDRRVAVRRAELRKGLSGGPSILGVRTTVLERDGGEPWVTAVFQDITDSKDVEALQRRAARLQGVAELSASLAHEIKNPLASIRSAVEQLTGRRLDVRDRGVLQRLVVTESDRLSRLLSEFIEYSRVEIREPREVDLRRVIAGAIELVGAHPDSAAGPAVELVDADPGRSLPSVLGDADLLHRAIFNLLLNAVQHAGPEGRVRVALSAVDGGVPFGASDHEAGSMVRVVVSDDGPGLDPADIPRLFDPFFTKREGGTGLGLALVHRAVEAHRGSVLVDARPGGGARFTVYLPAHAPVPAR